MDKPRPRHHAPLPLIIERPDLAHPARLALSYFLTACGWLIWLAMWVPFLAALGRHLGYPLPEIAFPSQISLHSFLVLANTLPFVAAGAIGLILSSYLWEKLKSRAGFPDRRWRPVGLERLAGDMALVPEQLATWQSAQILYVEHGPLGRVTGASIIPPGRPA
jgi:poly-beta-1,6-N-acetyl-D-glucosamine biosynthesis protein PgaD